MGVVNESDDKQTKSLFKIMYLKSLIVYKYLFKKIPKGKMLYLVSMVYETNVYMRSGLTHPFPAQT